MKEVFTKEFIKENEDLIASTVTPEEAVLLTCVFLEKDTAILNGETLASFYARSLVGNNKSGEAELTDIAKKTISLYPYPSPPTSSSYPHAIFSFILYFINRGTLSSDEKKRKKFFSSSAFISLFPLVESEKLEKAALNIVNAFIVLSVAVESGPFLLLNKEKALSFISLNEYQKISLIINPENPYPVSRLFLLMNSKKWKVDKDEENTLRENLVTPLSASGMLEEKSVTLSSDFTITVSGFSPIPLFLFSEPLKSDKADVYRITKNSIAAAFSSGVKEEEIFSFIDSISSGDNALLVSRIKLYKKEYDSFKTRRTILLETDVRRAKIIAGLPTLERYIIKRIEENVFLLDENEEEWREILKNAGFEMLPRPVSQKKEEEDFPLPIFAFPPLPLTREIPFKKENLLSPYKDALSQAAYLSGLFTFTPTLTFTDALHYSDKMNMIKHSEGNKLYIELLSKDVIIGKLEAFQEEKIKIKDEIVYIKDIWKVSLIPLYIKDYKSGKEKDVNFSN